MTDIPVSMNRNFNGRLQSRFNLSDYYLISGSGFGSKALPYDYYDDFQSRTSGAVVADIGRLVVSNKSGATISATGSRAGNKCFQNDYNVQRFPKAYIPLLSRSNNVKFSCWFKFEGTTTGGTNVWKFLRFSNTEGNDPYNGQNSFSHELTSTIGVANPVGNSTTIETDGGISSYWANAGTTDDTPANLFINGQWCFYQAEIQAGTVGGSDANIIIRVNNKRVNTFYNRPFLTATHPLGVSLVLTPIDGFDDYTSTTIKMSIGSVSCDTSLAECIMTDNAVYDSSTNWEPQPIQYMEDTKCYVNRKRGTFTSGATAYYHIWNTSGTYVGAFTGLVV